MKKLLISFAMLSMICSCQFFNQKGTKGDVEFETFSKTFIEDLWKQYPSWATGVGYHAYDSILIIPNRENDEKSLTFAKRYLDSLSSFDFEKPLRDAQDRLSTDQKFARRDFLLRQ